MARHFPASTAPVKKSLSSFNKRANALTTKINDHPGRRSREFSWRNRKNVVPGASGRPYLVVLHQIRVNEDSHLSCQTQRRHAADRESQDQCTLLRLGRARLTEVRAASLLRPGGFPPSNCIRDSGSPCPRARRPSPDRGTRELPMRRDGQ